MTILSTNGDVEEALKHLRSSNGYWNTSVLESKESSQVNNLSFPLLLCVVCSMSFTTVILILSPGNIKIRCFL